MFARTLDQLRIDPDEYFPARPFVEVVNTINPDHRQVYYGEKDLNWPVGSVVDLPDEKVQGLRWRVVRRWLYIPAVRITVATDDRKTALLDLEHSFLTGSGPYTAITQKTARGLVKVAEEVAVAAAAEAETETEEPTAEETMSDWQ